MYSDPYYNIKPVWINLFLFGFFIREIKTKIYGGLILGATVIYEYTMVNFSSGSILYIVI